MKNELKDGSGFTIGSCRYEVTQSTATGFYAQVVDTKDSEIKVEVVEETDEETIDDTFGSEDTKE